MSREDDPAGDGFGDELTTEVSAYLADAAEEGGGLYAKFGREYNQRERDVLIQAHPLVVAMGTPEMGQSLDEMAVYILMHDTESLTDLIHNLGGELGRLQRRLRTEALSDDVAASVERQFDARYRMHVRVRIIMNFSALADQALPNLRELQEDILAVEQLELPERVLWARIAAILNPHEKGIDLNDDEALTIAARLSAIRGAEEARKKDRERLARRLGREVADAVYRQMGIGFHDDLGVITEDIIRAAASMETVPEGVLRDVYRRIDDMNRPELRLAANKIIAAVRRIRGELDGT